MKHSLSVLSLLIMSGAAIGQEAYSAKSLFFGEDGEVVSASTTAKPATAANPASTVSRAKSSEKLARKTIAPKQIGAGYFIRLKHSDGSTEDVLASRSFRSGDRFQLGVKVNRPSYVYVLNQDPDGNLVQIFPVKTQDNYVDAMGTVFLPAKGAFEFDAKPGVEQLLVFLSPKPMKGNVGEQLRSTEPDMIANTTAPGERTMCPAVVTTLNGPGDADQTRVAIASTDAGYAAKGIAYKDDSSSCAAPTLAPAYAAKGIAFSDDPTPTPGGQVATYVVKKSTAKTDKNLFLKLKLNHQ
jgi:hypothetical protein